MDAEVLTETSAGDVTETYLCNFKWIKILMIVITDTFHWCKRNKACNSTHNHSAGYFY